MIDDKNIFHHPAKNDLRKYDNVCKIRIGQRDDYTTGCLLFYLYIFKNFKLMAIDLSKQQALDDDPKAIQQINFTGNLNRLG